MERLVELYKSFGIEVSPVGNAEGFSIELETRTQARDWKIVGCVGFYTGFQFNKEGKFMLQWIGE